MFPFVAVYGSTDVELVNKVWGQSKSGPRCTTIVKGDVAHPEPPLPPFAAVAPEITDTCHHLCSGIALHQLADLKL